MLNRIALLLLLLLALPGWAQSPKFKVLTLDIQLQDKFDRPFLVEENTAWLGVRLAQDEKQTNTEVRRHEVLSSAGIEYPRVTQEYVKFPLQKGSARAQFVVFEDNANPVDYELTLIHDNSFHPVSPSIWSIGTQSVAGEAKAEDLRAPHSKTEMAAMLAFGLVGFGYSYWLLGRVLFTRFLRQKHMEVGTALGWSNLLVLLGWTLVLCGLAVLIFFPRILWDKVYWIYVLVPAVCLLIVSLLYAAGHLFSRN